MAGRIGGTDLATRTTVVGVGIGIDTTIGTYLLTGWTRGNTGTTRTEFVCTTHRPTTTTIAGIIVGADTQVATQGQPCGTRTGSCLAILTQLALGSTTTAVIWIGVQTDAQVTANILAGWAGKHTFACGTDLASCTFISTPTTMIDIHRYIDTCVATNGL